MKPRIPVTDEIRAKLRLERNRTGIAPSTLLRLSKDAVPKGLSLRMPGHWIRGDAAHVDPDHLEFVLRLYERQPTVKWESEADSRFRDIVQSEILRTGVRPGRLLGASSSNKPEGLSSYAVSRWMKGTGPQIAQSYLAYLLDQYAALPTIRSVRAPISDIFRQNLEAERRRTGFSSARLLAESKDPPEGLTANMINSWLTGGAKTALKSHMDWAVRSYALIESK